ncbi:MAG: endonuclease III domain-containing protein [Thermoplasmatota archaeon]
MEEIKALYVKLLKEFGYQNWWPGETKFEVVVGAILTQNVSWSNVETAIQNLKKSNLLSPKKILNTDDEKLYELIEPTGFYRQKTSRLKRISRTIKNNGGLEDFFKIDDLRKKLLDIKGIGPETADSIILYAAEEPSFVVDAYTNRILKRSFGIEGSYNEIKNLFEDSLDKNLLKLQEIHALLVELGKNHCSKNDPSCERCPLSSNCRHANQR